MSLAPGLETLEYEFPGSKPAGVFAPLVVGVVGSGNLEVMLEPLNLPLCRVTVLTSARGFGGIWQAVLADFQQRHGLAGVRVSINDMGATPAVVSLRLSQAAAGIAKAQP